jgi:hypothetical protein
MRQTRHLVCYWVGFAIYATSGCGTEPAAQTGEEGQSSDRMSERPIAVFPDSFESAPAGVQHGAIGDKEPADPEGETAPSNSNEQSSDGTAAPAQDDQQTTRPATEEPSTDDPSAQPGDDDDLPDHCRNGVTDRDETSTDCGGACHPCDTGETCRADGDCASERCSPVGWVTGGCEDGGYLELRVTDAGLVAECGVMGGAGGVRYQPVGVFGATFSGGCRVGESGRTLSLRDGELTIDCCFYERTGVQIGRALGWRERCQRRPIGVQGADVAGAGCRAGEDQYGLFARDGKLVVQCRHEDATLVERLTTPRSEREITFSAGEKRCY